MQSSVQNDECPAAPSVFGPLDGARKDLPPISLKTQLPAAKCLAPFQRSQLQIWDEFWLGRFEAQPAKANFTKQESLRQMQAERDAEIHEVRKILD